MKNIITFSIIVLICFQAKASNVILIKHIGISDKPINTISIFQGERMDALDHFFLQEKEYDIISSIIQRKKSIYNGSEYGTFNVNICNNNNHVEVVLNRKQSLELFHEIINQLNNGTRNKNLIERLKTITKRITI